MSIYRTFLEEDLELGGVLDDDNSIELKQIEDVVNDQDANAFEQDEAQAAEFGTSYGEDEIVDPEEIVDESFIAIAEAEMNYNKIMMAVGIHEISETAAGREVIYEAADIKGYLKRAKDWVVSFFKKVWQVLKRVAANIASTFRTNKGLADKYAKQIKDGEAAYKNRDNNKMKMYTYENLDKLMDSDKWNGIKAMNAVSLNSIKGGLETTQALSTDFAYNTARKYRAAICGTECDAGEFREKLHDYVCGGSEKKEGYMSADSIITILKNGKEIKNAKKAMDGAQKEYKDAIKKLNELEKKFSRQANDKDAGKAAAGNQKMETCVRMTDAVKQILTATQVARATILSAARARMGQARAYAHAYIYAANKSNPNYKGFQKESAEYGFLSNLELL